MENSSHKYIPAIDIVRAIAFLLVVIVHFSVSTWTDGITDPNFAESIILSIIKTGWIGVPLFLFISGYSLAINKTKADYALNLKQFYVNRLLRIMPVWIACVLILKWTQKLSGEKFFSLLLLNVQDIPPSTAFGIAWSIQLEFFCYFLFPMFLAVINNFRQVALIYATLLAFKAMVSGVPAQMAWDLSYGSVFGEATIFLSGMMARRFIESTSTLKEKLLPYAKWLTAAGIVLFVALLHFITTHGGYQTASGKKMVVFFLLMPELCSVIFALMVVPYFLKSEIQRKPLSLIGKIFAHMGKVSYSAYMFSLFVLDFMQAVMHRLDIFQPGGWGYYSLCFLLYLPVLIGFSTLTYHTIEKPFLSKRKKY